MSEVYQVFSPTGAAGSGDGSYRGVSLRDHIAIKAMEIIIKSASQGATATAIADGAYSMADAMLEARKKQRP